MIGPTSAAVRRSESAITLVRKADEQISQSRYVDAASTLERAGIEVAHDQEHATVSDGRGS